jgi:hypothetical protein
MISHKTDYTKQIKHNSKSTSILKRKLQIISFAFFSPWRLKL